MPDDFSPLEPSRHMLRWFSEDPYGAIRDQLQGWLTGQVPGCALTDLLVAGEPDWLTGARPGDDGSVVLLRTGVAFPFELLVAMPDGEEVHVEGVYTWVAWNLDTQAPLHRVWVAVGGTMDDQGRNGALALRLNTPEA